MTKNISATEARVHFGALLRRVVERNEPVVVERSGKPQVVILSVSEYQRLQLLETARVPWPGQVRAVRERLSTTYGSRTIPPSEEIIRQMRAERGIDASDLR